MLRAEREVERFFWDGFARLFLDVLMLGVVMDLFAGFQQEVSG